MFSARWTAPDAYTVRSDARRFENWENNYAARLGLGAAVEHAMNLGLDAIEARIAVLADRLRAGLRAVPGVSVHDIGRRTCGIVTFTVDGADAGAVKAALSEKSINTSVSNPSSTLLDATRRGLADINRASVHVTNTEDEIDTALSAIEGIAASARRA
jgi:cysteine desulfurase/selenocysteine lyase